MATPEKCAPQPRIAGRKTLQKLRCRPDQYKPLTESGNRHIADWRYTLAEK
jgi:hypothetical protein